MNIKSIMENNDALKIAPEVHSLLFENEKVRVLNVYLAVGKKTEMHWHPDNISYIIQGGKMRVTKPTGIASEVELIAGKVVAGTEGEHIVENIGNSDIHTIQTEFKR
ncbi:cytoplasmic protein [Candidatus Jorgensenbacteria bacterium]|nr:cytoplasmic protein [Candidatus Jorgensenbacteria bacterium]